jgi:capsular polysaccharide biosynthesis protein
MTVAVLVVGGWFAATQQTTWAATASVLVVPRSTGVTADQLAGLYDALSRGQVPATYAELVRDRGLLDQASKEEGFDPSAFSLTIEVVPETSVIDLAVSTERAADAERVADGIQSLAVTYLNTLSSPYDVTVVGSAEGTARRTGLPTIPLAAVVVCVGVLAGAVTALAVNDLSNPADRLDNVDLPVPVTIVEVAAPLHVPIPPGDDQVRRHRA